MGRAPAPEKAAIRQGTGGEDGAAPVWNPFPATFSKCNSGIRGYPAECSEYCIVSQFETHYVNDNNNNNNQKVIVIDVNLATLKKLIKQHTISYASSAAIVAECFFLKLTMYDMASIHLQP